MSPAAIADHRKPLFAAILCSPDIGPETRVSVAFFPREQQTLFSGPRQLKAIAGTKLADC